MPFHQAIYLSRPDHKCGSGQHTCSGIQVFDQKGNFLQTCRGGGGRLWYNGNLPFEITRLCQHAIAAVCHADEVLFKKQNWFRYRLQICIFSGLVIGWWSKLRAAPPYPSQIWVPPPPRVLCRQMNSIFTLSIFEKSNVVSVLLAKIIYAIANHMNMN